MIFNPKIYQEIIYNHINKHKRCAIWASMGMGKTSASLYALNAISLIEKEPTLIIAPLRVAKNVWSDEVAKWDNFNHFEIVPIIGNKDQRYKALKQHADIFTINYENIPWLYENTNFKFSTIIVDESTKLKSFRLRQGGKRASVLSKVAFKNVNRFIELTGTPSPNGLIDLWGQIWFLDKGERLGRTFTSFLKRWFKLKHPNSFDYIAMPHSQKEIEGKLKDICLSLQAKDYFNLKEPIVNNIGIHLPTKCLKQYREFERNLYIELNTIEVNANFAAARSIKCLQMASGAVYDEDKNFEVTHDEKLYALESIINEHNGSPILVAYHFNSDLFRLKKHFPKGVELTRDSNIINEFNAGKIPLLFVHPGSAGHGLSLHYGSNIIVFFSHWWDLEQYQQVIERIGPTRQMQAGFDRPVFIYNIYAKNTIDEMVIQRRENKKTIQEALLNSIRSRDIL